MPHINDRISKVLMDRTGRVLSNPARSLLIENAVAQKSAIRMESGTLATWTAPNSTGRSPKDTWIVKHPESEAKIDWSSKFVNAMTPETFDMLFEDVTSILERKRLIYTIDRLIGADSSYALPVHAIVHNPLAALFMDNMFRPLGTGKPEGVFKDKPFYLLVTQFDRLDPERYKGRLRELEDGTTTTMAVAIDFDRRVGIVFGSSYMGTMKKLMFTTMNYYLPDEGILPLHCSANEDQAGNVAIFLGLSGTGKTTLSTDPERALIGDDEHGWSDSGIANFENGCYAKLINIDPLKEPGIYNAIFHPDHYLSHGGIVENLMVYANGTFDLDDSRLTENSRASYPIRYLANTKEGARGGHPSTIFFLTADANGVLPPISRLTIEQAMLWFMMGYTSKVPGTETGVVTPQSTFSRFFGEPFMPCKPSRYIELLEARLRAYKTRVFLINTGWTGGPHGEGARMPLEETRSMLQAALSGELDSVEYHKESLFGLEIPLKCSGVDSGKLIPEKSWSDPERYRERARELIEEFSAHFDREFAGKVDPRVAEACPRNQ